ncbi:MAG: zinc-ribbon domain-containing protein [Desulfohalobiaceae bacterium]
MQIKCPKCGFSRDVPEEKIPPRTQLATCPKCKHKFKFRELASPLSVDPGERAKHHAPTATAGESSTPDQETSPPGREQSIWEQLESLGSEDSSSDREESDPTRTHLPGTAVPWENLESYGLVHGFFQTIKQAMLHPMSFFGGMSPVAGLVKPLVFFLVISEIQALAQIVWQLLGIVPGMQDNGGTIIGISLAGLGSLFLLILLPILLTVSLFIFAGLSHLCLMALKSASGGFQATFRAMCYGRAPLILSVVPVLGVLAGTFWTFYSTIIGLKQLHKSSLPAAAAGLFVPILLFLGLMLLLVSTLAGQPGANP